MRVYYLIILFALSIAGSSFAEEMASPSDHAFSTLVENEKYFKNLLELSEQEISNNGCHTQSENGTPYYVHDYILGYLRFFNSPDPNKNSGFVECGFIDENICEFYYAQKNIEGEMGASWNLRFELNPKDGKIIPESIECWAM